MVRAKPLKLLLMFRRVSTLHQVRTLLLNRVPVDPCLKSRVFGMYGPPLCRKRKVRIAGKVCAYVYGLVGVIDYPGPGWNALRSVPN